MSTDIIFLFSYYTISYMYQYNTVPKEAQRKTTFHKYLNPFRKQAPDFTCLQNKSFEHTVGRREIACN